jgi:hypothetical protein
MKAGTVAETSGTVHADGTLELDQKVPVPPGKVKVRVESLEVARSSQESRVRALVQQWKEATLLMSSITEMATHPAYQQIIGRAIPRCRGSSMNCGATRTSGSGRSRQSLERTRFHRRIAATCRAWQAWLGWAKEHGY